ncbi:MAG: tetraacyldisaccharide 4'-kinase [Pirellulaceae bacterium]
MVPAGSSSTFHEVISGRGERWPAAVLRGCLRLAEIPYTWVVEYRNERFDHARTPIHRVPVPVISVGNITTGGTGKTPLVAWLAHWLASRGRKVTLISRGYKKSHAHGPNDEARELQLRLPAVPHLQNPDRVAAARTAIQELGCDVIVLDDAFQHRRIHRDLDIVLIDALEPFGYRHLLPRGLLREPLKRLARAQVIGLSRADAVEAAERMAVREEVHQLAPRATWMELAHRPQQLVNARGETESVTEFTGRCVAAFCGIGNPDAFRRSLERLGYTVGLWQRFPDHHAYGREDLRQLESALAQHPEVAAVICTCKDLVKLDATHLGQIPLWALEIAMEVTSGLAGLESALHRVLRGQDQADR